MQENKQKLIEFFSFVNNSGKCTAVPLQQNKTKQNKTRLCFANREDHTTMRTRALAQSSPCVDVGVQYHMITLAGNEGHDQFVWH